ncbi:hypothetical protein D8S78_08600 [Natrialba swarupiae]|nr:hypothetical protein [Natrialba swarupiae]
MASATAASSSRQRMSALKRSNSVSPTAAQLILGTEASFLVPTEARAMDGEPLPGMLFASATSTGVDAFQNTGGEGLIEQPWRVFPNESWTEEYDDETGEGGAQAPRGSLAALGIPTNPNQSPRLFRPMRLRSPLGWVSRRVNSATDLARIGQSKRTRSFEPTSC